MDAQTAGRNYSPGSVWSVGKTKIVHETREDTSLAILTSKDDITAGDGKKHDVIPEKGRLANETTCNVFRLLEACGVPVAFKGRLNEEAFLAPKCQMLPYEVVVRREAHGSYLKRNPHLSKGQLFPKLLVEFFLKTKNRRWKEHELVCDDPFMFYSEAGGSIWLYDPAKSFHWQEPFLELRETEVFGYDEEWKIFPEMRRIASQAFLVLEKAWQLAGRKLVDFKVEFGFDNNGALLLADVIDNDSWRVIESGAYIDKQMYRDGGTLDDVAAKYRHVAELTARFEIPQQRIILWRGSEKDNLSSFIEVLTDNEVRVPFVPFISVTCSMHKQPVVAVNQLHQLVQEVPDSVVIAYIGRSNGAGPTLSAVTTVPVITVPASVRDFPDDVWSSLRAPSEVPVLTALEPYNAVWAAFHILSARNPKLYALSRQPIEERTENMVMI